MKKHKVFSNLLETQKTNRDLVVSSVLLAVGVNLLSTGIAELTGAQYRAWTLTMVGMLICLGVVVWNLYSKLHNASNMIKVEGFVIYNAKKHELIAVPEYSISTDMVGYLQAACTENKAIEKIWTSGTINKFAAMRNQNNESEGSVTPYCGDIFVELLEYCIINKLSRHLSTFFVNHPERSEVAELCSTDVPDVLLKNRFLKLFSEDMDNRALFVCSDKLVDKSETGTVITAYNSSGARYNRFDLTLPKGSKVSRKSKNQLLVDMPVLSMTLEIVYGSYVSVLKSSFKRFYVGIRDDFRDYQTYAFAIKVDVKFKPKVFFSKEKENYYAWIDSFMDALEAYASKEQFFNGINWNTVDCLIRSMNNTRRPNKTDEQSAKPKVSYTIIEEDVEE